MPHVDDILYVGRARAEMRMVTLMEVKGQQRSNGVNYCAMATIFGQRSPDAS